MPRANAFINKETLSYICTHIGITTAFIARRMRVSEDIISKWLVIKDDTIPTINQAKALANVLKIPFAGLYMNKENINLKHLPNLRNLRTMPDSEKIDDSALNLALMDLIRTRDFLMEAEIDLGIETKALSLPSIVSSLGVKEYAKTIRSFFGLELEAQSKSTSTRQFYLYVREKIESKGIFVHCFSGVEVEAVRGMAIFDGISPIIGINEKDRYPAKTFSIIHELVHIIKHESALCNDMYFSFSSQNEEVFCNAVAGEVLVPEASLVAYMNTHDITKISFNDINTISERYRVSKEVIARRLYDTGYFKKDEYDKVANEIQQSFHKEREAAKQARTEAGEQGIPRNMSREAIDKTSASVCRLLLIGYGEGYFSKQDISGLLGVKEKHITKFLSEVTRW